MTGAKEAHGGGRGRCQFHPASAEGVTGQRGQLPQLEAVIPHLDFITLPKCSFELALPAHWRDRSIPASVCSALEQRWGQWLLQPLASQSPSQRTLGAVGQVNQRAGNKLNIDVKGDKTTALLNSEAYYPG